MYVPLCRCHPQNSLFLLNVINQIITTVFLHIFSSCTKRITVDCWLCPKLRYKSLSFLRFFFFLTIEQSQSRFVCKVYNVELTVY